MVNGAATAAGSGSFSLYFDFLRGSLSFFTCRLKPKVTPYLYTLDKKPLLMMYVLGWTTVFMPAPKYVGLGSITI